MKFIGVELYAGVRHEVQDLSLSPRQRTIENSPAIHRWDWQEPERKSVKRTAEKKANLAVIISRLQNPSALTQQ